ncbi:uncharacterized protein LOC110061038, partial [Orbicella faveolata]|uniref:uncharacterized protein LOC110061038 n=1 Tax=Orbicella faveolata TaxID=48498 RepID=UPI0009E3827C
MDDIESKRPESPIGTSKEKELIMKLIRHKLREVMMRVDLEEVTSRQLRTMLEADTQMELKEYRSFIDKEMIVIMGQMDSASKIFDHVYLGSEWNASNLEELKENGVGYILNITREIDNFFPGTFHYHNIRVYDLDETELLHHWDNTYRFIQRAKNAGSKVLVHCRMGISRSASTVIAYGMKEYGWSLGDTMKYVKARRSVVQPNAGFWKQLITYEGILISSKRRDHWADVEVSNSAAAVKKRKEKSSNSADENDKHPQMALHVESVDTVDNVPIETESSLKLKESPDVSIKELGVLRATLDSTGELVEGTSLERNETERVPSTSSPIGPDPESTAESSKEALEGPNYVPPSSHASEIPIKTSLQRVSSDPTLANDDQKKKGKDEESIGNFRRSCSLRERGTRKLQELHSKARSASDENLKDFERKKKQILGLDEPETSDLQDVKNTFEGLLPSDLHGVLESGFVKRYSRKFEGVDDVPELEGNAALTSTEEVRVECAPAEGDKIPEEEQDESMPNEEPEPGVVKKHKEGYELKHRESLKRRALLQRGGSDERKSAKQEGDEVEGSLAVDADSESVQTAGELGDELRGVNVVALVKRVNEDMKKEVNIRRISASKKEQDLRAYVEKAGERMKNALVNDEDGTLPKDKSTVSNEVDSEQISEESFTGKIKRNTRVFVLEEDSRDLPSNDSQLTGTLESRQPVVLKPSVAHNVSASVESVIEGKLQPLGQEELEKGTGDQQAREVNQEVGLSVSKGKTRSADAYTEQENRTISQDGTEPSEITIQQAVTSELLEDKKDEQSEQNSENILQKGLVKRHKLLIEGKLQPLDQEIEKSVERPDGQESHFAVGQKGSSSLSEGETDSAALHTERTEVNVVQNMNSGME